MAWHWLMLSKKCKNLVLKSIVVSAQSLFVSTGHVTFCQFHFVTCTLLHALESVHNWFKHLKVLMPTFST